jgi:lysophospholipase L1-like esterase
MQKMVYAVCDLYSDGGLNADNTDQRLKYTYDSYNKGTGDGTHPNEEGYEKFYVPEILEKMT